LPITVLNLKQARAADLASTLQQVFTTEGVQVTASDRTNSLIIRADDKSLQDVKKLIEQLDVPAVEKPKPADLSKQ
jgi:type II secretory pathway component GspD/PulD (secretin)